MVCLPDNDKPGEKYALDALSALHGFAQSVKKINLPGLPDKGDLSDWVQAGGTAEVLWALIEAASEWEAPAEAIHPAEHAKNTEAGFRKTELGLAERFCAMHGDNIRYVVLDDSRGYWLLWSGLRWEPDRTLRIREYAVAVVRSIYAEASEAGDKSERTALATHATRSESKHAIAAMIDLAKSKLAVRPEDLDAQADLLCTANALIDLKTGLTLQADHADGKSTFSTLGKARRSQAAGPASALSGHSRPPAAR